MNKGKDDLELFYNGVRAGTTVAQFLEDFERIISFVHAAGLINDFRLGRSRAKKLRDEVYPVSLFVKQHAKGADQIKSALDNSFPDCVVSDRNGRDRKIEVTVAQGRARYYQMTELNTSGTGRGFLGIQDSANGSHFEKAMSRDRCAYSTDEALKTVIDAIRLCVRKKKNHDSHTLLIDALLEPLSPDDWEAYLPQLSEPARELSFSEVYVTGLSDGREVCLRIK